MADEHNTVDLPPHQHIEDVSSHGEHHIVPIPVYLWVFGALMVLLVVTLLAAAIDLGPWNILIAMTIAVAKAALVVLFFMHVRYSSSLVQFFAGATFFWLLILFVLTLSDYFSRNWVAVPQI